MMSLIGVVVAQNSLTHIGLGDQLQLFQQLQSAVYGGDIDLGVFGSNLGIDLLGTDMAFGIMYCLDHQRPLRRQPIALLSQGLKTTHIRSLPYFKNYCNWLQLSGILALGVGKFLYL